MKPFPDQVVRWARGDLADADFEQWLYSSKTAEEALGEATWLDLIKLDYRDPYATLAMRKRLIERISAICMCPLLVDRQVLPLSSATADFEKRFGVLRKRTPWLRLSRCEACGQRWYIALDTVDDSIFLQRLGEAEVRAVLDRDEWPATFDRFAHVWPPGTVGGDGRPRDFTDRGAQELILQSS